MESNSKITFYGGIHEIGGNKFLVEDKGTRVFLDFGMQMGLANYYFSEFLQARKLNGMGDLFEFKLLPRLRGLYRRDYSKHVGDDDYKEDTAFDAVLLSHAHVDHGAYIHYLRPEIPIYCTEATKLILQCFQDTGSDEQYITYKENFKIYKNTKGEMSRARKETREELPRNIKIIDNSKKFSIDSIEVEALAVDHSLPGVCGYIIHTSKGSIAYTGDIRFHGRRRKESESFVEKCGSSELDYLLCEGTRVEETFSRTELDVEEDAKKIINTTKNLVICSYPTRDLDRMLSFYNAAKETGRQFVVDLKQAYLLKLFQASNTLRGVYPKPDDSNIRIYIPRKSWGLIDKDPSYWTEKQILADYDEWEQGFLDYKNAINYRHVSTHQNELIFSCNDYQLQQLIDIRPAENSAYLRSSTEPFDDEMKLDEKRVKGWLVHFGLISKEQQWNHSHVSGHGSGDQIKAIIDGARARTLIPVHTEHEEYHEKWHGNVKRVAMNESVELN